MFALEEMEGPVVTTARFELQDVENAAVEAVCSSDDFFSFQSVVITFFSMFEGQSNRGCCIEGQLVWSVRGCDEIESDPAGFSTAIVRHGQCVGKAKLYLKANKMQ